MLHLSASPSVTHDSSSNPCEQPGFAKQRIAAIGAKRLVEKRDKAFLDAELRQPLPPLGAQHAIVGSDLERDLPAEAAVERPEHCRVAPHSDALHVLEPFVEERRQVIDVSPRELGHGAVMVSGRQIGQSQCGIGLGTVSPMLELTIDDIDLIELQRPPNVSLRATISLAHALLAIKPKLAHPPHELAAVELAKELEAAEAALTTRRRQSGEAEIESSLREFDRSVDGTWKTAHDNLERWATP
jgi:hypothetical protein